MIVTLPVLIYTLPGAEEVASHSEEVVPHTPQTQASSSVVGTLCRFLRSAWHSKRRGEIGPVAEPGGSMASIVDMPWRPRLESVDLDVSVVRNSRRIERRAVEAHGQGHGPRRQFAGETACGCSALMKSRCVGGC